MVGKVVFGILSVLLIVGIAGALTCFISKQEGVTYYVEYSGERFYGNSYGKNLWMEPGKAHTFQVKSLSGKEVDYTVTITSNEGTNFEFSLDDRLYVWHGSDKKNNDYTAMFEIEKKTDGFTVTAPQKAMVQDALEWKYGGEVVILEELPQAEYFLLTISVADSVVVFPCLNRRAMCSVTITNGMEMHSMTLCG